MNENIIIAAIGGLVYNVVPLLELWKTPRESRPDFNDPLYWLPYFGWPLIAGFLLYIYESPELKLTKLIAFHIGISAPLLVRAMIEILPLTPGTIKLRDNNQ